MIITKLIIPVWSTPGIPGRVFLTRALASGRLVRAGLGALEAPRITQFPAQGDP